MKIYYSLSFGGFIHEELWGELNLPADAIEISDQEYQSLQRGVPGRQQIVVKDGRPELEDLPVYEPTHEELVTLAHQLRRAAYVAESDPIKNEADYDALVSGTAPDYTAWIAAVEAIKARYPLPEL